VIGRLRRGRGREQERGQSLIEFSLIVPIMTLIILGMLEFGFMFDHALTASYATREGARMGAAMANGTTSVPCANVDAEIVTTVQRVLANPGSRIELKDVSEIRIYRATAAGSEAGPVEVWTYDDDAGVFKKVSGNWPACSRINSGANLESIGVSVTYRYPFITPLGAAGGLFGGGLVLTDRTVMALNPKYDY
jgi:hypothetical protein